jgi:Flp pilus assembly protein TadD
MWRILAFCLCLGVLAACAAGSQQKTAAKPPAPPPVPESVKKEQEARFITDVYRALDEGDMATADALLRRVTLINPDSVEARAAQGEIFIRLSRYQEAVNIFNRLIFEKKLLARAHQGAGLANLQMNQQTLAKTNLQKAVALDSKLWRAWNGLGFYYDRHKEWKKAERSYNNALKVKSDRPSLFNNRGFSKLMQGSYESAISDFNSALRLNPDLMAARMNIRLALAWLGRYVEAIAGATRDELPEVLNNVGYVAMLKGEFPVAEAYFSRAMERSPSYNETAATNLKKLEVLRSQSAHKSKISKR